MHLVANVIIVALWLVVLGKVTVVVEDKKKAKRAIPKSVKTLITSTYDR